VRVRVGDRRVFIGGKAVTVFQGELKEPSLTPKIAASDGEGA